MEIDDERLRTMLARRAGRQSVTAIVDGLNHVTGGDQDRRSWKPFGTLRATFGAAATVLVAVVIATLAVTTRQIPTVGSTPPVGLFQSDVPVGTGAVGSKICIGLQLDDHAYQARSTTIWWWLVGPRGCRTSTSGVTAADATITPVATTDADGLPSRMTYRVELVLQLLPSGTEVVAFVLDPDGAPPGTKGLQTYAGTSVSKSPLLLTPVSALAVDEPGNGPI